ncbi:MAG: hypothetical protein JXA42_10540 [Anaerolineales bacterium]|nr:hypothetical protein [Anaerolineales bacterium]
MDPGLMDDTIKSYTEKTDAPSHFDSFPLIDNTPTKVEAVYTGPDRTITLIAGKGRQLERPAAAQELYTSQWFKNASVYARGISDSWYILSAKYGLAAPEDLIEPYDMTLAAMPAGSRRTWALQILLKLHNKLKAGDRVVILAEELYREFLVPSLEKWGCRVEIPAEELLVEA